MKWNGAAAWQCAPILEDIKALTVNAVMPSFPDDSLTKTRTHRYAHTRSHPHLQTSVCACVCVACCSFTLFLGFVRKGILLRHIITIRIRPVRLSVVSCLKSQFFWRSTPVALCQLLLHLPVSPTPLPGPTVSRSPLKSHVLSINREPSDIESRRVIDNVLVAKCVPEQINVDLFVPSCDSFFLFA